MTTDDKAQASGPPAAVVDTKDALNLTNDPLRLTLKTAVDQFATEAAKHPKLPTGASLLIQQFHLPAAFKDKEAERSIGIINELALQLHVADKTFPHISFHQETADRIGVHASGGVKLSDALTALQTKLADQKAILPVLDAAVKEVGVGQSR